jgi:ribosomal protein S18 acetylase RimI-like enzyme
MPSMSQPVDSVAEAIHLRTQLRPGDLGMIVYLHGTIYARERGFDPTFEAYVAGPLAEFVKVGSPRERLWIAERGTQLVGCIAIVAAGPRTAQLRWFLVDPSARGCGLGKRLLREALAFCRLARYAKVILQTESVLTVAARLYEAAGFRKTEQKPGRRWGVDVVEEWYELRLSPSDAEQGETA